MQSKYQIELRELHPKQQEFVESKAKRKVIVAGRRGGKTTGVSDLATNGMIDGHRVLYAAPTQEQTDGFWDLCKRWMGDLVTDGICYKNEQRRLLEMPDGGRIRAKTAWDADTLRGDYADLLILDEYSLMDPSAWEEVGAPMLLDNDGNAVFIFTPKRRNHAYKRYLRAKSDETGRWGVWHFTSHDNPFLSKEALAEITEDMTADAYKQEIMAEFLESAGAVFRNITASLYKPNGAGPSAHVGHEMVMGVDWAKQNDFTALSVFCADCRQEVALERFNEIDYILQRQRLAGLAEIWGVGNIQAESNAMGEPNIEALQQAGLPVSGFATTSASKPPLIENLVLAFERREAQWLDDEIATTELEAYERKVSNVGRSSYSAPEGMHDDTVIARALAYDAVTSTVGVMVV